MLKPAGHRASDALKKASKVGKANRVGKMWPLTAKAGEHGGRAEEPELKVLRAEFTRRSGGQGSSTGRGWLHRGTPS